MMDFGSRQASIKSVLTCVICKKLCKKVTIIEECCHRFCKKCITRRITEEKLNNCPVCNLDLGTAPLQKIRPDNQVQGIRDILSNRRRECIERGKLQDYRKGQEQNTADHDDHMLIDNPLPTNPRRKQKSISSLVNTRPDDDQVITNHHNVSGGRRKGHTRNANNAPRFQDHSSKLNINSTDEPNQIQVDATPYAAESSKNATKQNGEPLDGMNDLLEPLNTLKGGKSNKAKSPEPAKDFSPVGNLDDDEEDEEDEEEDEEYVPSKTNKGSKVSKSNTVHQEEEKRASANPSTSGKGKSTKGRRGRKKKETPPSPGERSNVPDQVVRVNHEATSSKQNERINPIWFTLVASDKQEGPSPLPQIPSRYLKIKDANMPVSHIKKFLARKLSLVSEDEVEIRMLGIPILPALPLERLVELWLRAAPSMERIETRVGSSAKDFVMVLTYGRSNRYQAN